MTRLFISWMSGSLVVLLIWAMGHLGMGSDTIPSPGSVLSLIATNAPFFLHQAAVSTLHAALGLLLAILIGLVIVGTVGCYSSSETLFYPYVIVAQATPAVAFVPVYVALVGYGVWSKVLTATMISFAPIVIAGIDGTKRCPDRLHSLAASYGASRWSVFVRIRLPYALCGSATGVKTAAPLAVVGALVGEYVAGGRPTGLGTYILRSYAEFFPSQVFAGVLVSTGIGLSFFVVAYLLAAGLFKVFRVSQSV